MNAYKEKLKPLTREVAGLLLTQRDDGKQQLVHIEIQSVTDPEMGDRMLVYHVLARTQYHLPVLSCVIYLRQDGPVPQPPHRWHAADGSVTNDFHYRVIEIANITTQELRAFGEPGPLPRLPLTRGGESREVAEEMLVELQGVGNLDLLQLGQMMASLAFGEARPQDKELGWAGWGPGACPGEPAPTPARASARPPRRPTPPLAPTAGASHSDGPPPKTYL